MSGILETLLTGSIALVVAFGTIWYKNKLDKRKKGEDLNEDYIRKSKIYPILEEIRYQLNAERVQEWAFSNGDTTFAGQHLKKMSILVENNDEHKENIAHYFQLIPTKKFERNLDALYESDSDHIVSNEFIEHDELSALYSQFSVRTVLLIKLTDNFNKWVGLLTVMFEDNKAVNEGEIAFCQLQASRLASIK